MPHYLWYQYSKQRTLPSIEKQDEIYRELNWIKNIMDVDEDDDDDDIKLELNFKFFIYKNNFITLALDA